MFGEALFDHFADGTRVLGGAPFNVAWHLQGFKADPLLITAVGTDQEGDAILRRMGAWGMGTEGVQSHSSRPTGRVTAHLEDGDPWYDIEAGQAYDAISIIDLPSRSDLQGIQLLYHGTLALREAESAGTLTHLRASLGVPVLVDVNLREPWWQREGVLEQLKSATWVKLNREEAALLADTPTDDRRGIEEATGKLHRLLGIENLVVTMGEAGAMASTPEGSHWQAATSSEGNGGDPVGAGDAFSAVLALAIHEGWPLEVTLNRATAFAGELCGIRGATAEEDGLYSRHLRRWADAS